MVKPVVVRNLTIGTGKPKVIVPIVGATREEIVAKAESFSAYEIDMVEWRVDFYEDVFEEEKLLETLKQLRAALGETPLLFTFRTKNEGGEKAITPEEYLKINTAVAKSGNADVIDVEIFMGDEIVKANIDAIHAENVLVVGSNHDFFKTPDRADLVSRLKKMLDYKEVGGAPMLGISKTVVKAHGSSNGQAICNAVGQAIAFERSGFIRMVEENIDLMTLKQQEEA